MGFILVLTSLIGILALSKPNVAGGTVEPLKVGAFNVRVFGASKMQKKDVSDILVKVINRYDIILIQEIRDASGKSINTLLAEVNKLASKDNHKYKMVISHGIGRSVSKEQYAFLYRDDLVSVDMQYTYSDSKDAFEREPFIVRFSAPLAAVHDMVFVAIHTKPSAAVQEINSLVDVYHDIVQKWNTKNIVIMGDLNAACNYVKDKEWKNIRLAYDKTFWWLIDDCQDTSIEGLRCAYDRFIATGSELLNAVVVNSAKVFNFKKAYNLNEKQAADVSDHFPIEFHIKGAAWGNVQEHMEYVLTNTLPTITKNDVLAVRKGALGRQITNLGFTQRSLYKKSGGVSQITLLKTVDIGSAVTCLEELHKVLPALVTETQCQMTKYYLSKFHAAANKYPYQVLTQYTAGTTATNINIQITWDVEVSPIVSRMIIRRNIQLLFSI